MNRYWVFDEQQLDSLLAAREAERQRAGATEQQAKDETVTIKAFLLQAEILQGKQIRSADEIRADLQRQNRL